MVPDKPISDFAGSKVCIFQFKIYKYFEKQTKQALRLAIKSTAFQFLNLVENNSSP